VDLVADDGDECAHGDVEGCAEGQVHPGAAIGGGQMQARGIGADRVTGGWPVRLGEERLRSKERYEDDGGQADHEDTPGSGARECLRPGGGAAMRETPHCHPRHLRARGWG
jgi:hypothetical protein